MGKKILVIEDEKGIRSVIKDYLMMHQYSVTEASDGFMGLKLFNRENYDLVIVDIMMPKIDGWSVVREIRKTSKVPIIILTARSEEYDELMGFELEADDYIHKPFKPQILIARVKRLLNKNSESEDGNYAFDTLIISETARDVTLEGESLILTPKEFDILLLLVKHERQALSRQKILDAVWGIDYFGDDRIVDNHIKNIRKALRDQSFLIRTVFGIGYKFEVK